MSVFGGTAWSWNNERKQFYYHQFNSMQPDYNIRNPKIQQEIYVDMQLKFISIMIIFIYSYL